MTTRTFAAALAAATALGLGVGAVGAAAHSGAVATSPAAGRTVAKLPGTVSVTFAAPLGRAGTARITRNGRGDLAGRVLLDPGNRARMLIRVKRPGKAAARRGVMRVRWTARALDGHTIAGVFAFRVR